MVPIQILTRRARRQRHPASPTCPPSAGDRLVMIDATDGPASGTSAPTPNSPSVLVLSVEQYQDFRRRSDPVS
jgi:hypothetical protein